MRCIFKTERSNAKQADPAQPPARLSQITVSGYYGCGNAGDEAVLAGIQEAFRRYGGTGQLVALSQNPSQTHALHGLDAVDRMNVKALRDTIRSSRLLLSGGGSLLQDTTSVRSLLYYLWVVRIALNFRVPVMFYAQGMGPFHRRVSRLLVRLAANRVSYITVRDEPSARLLESIGVTRPPIEVTADPAFALSSAPMETVDACWHAEGLPSNGRRKIGVALRAWGKPEEARDAAYARLLNSLEEQTGAQVILIPMQIPDDVNFSEKIARLAGKEFPLVRHPYTPAVLLGLVARMDIIVAMRLHTLIFAARAAVPPFALAYDPKVDNLMRRLNLESCIAAWERFVPEDIAERVGDMLRDKANRSSELKSYAAELERKALRNAEIALSLIHA